MSGDSQQNGENDNAHKLFGSLVCGVLAFVVAALYKLPFIICLLISVVGLVFGWYVGWVFVLLGFFVCAFFGIVNIAYQIYHWLSN